MRVFLVLACFVAATWARGDQVTKTSHFLFREKRCEMNILGVAEIVIAPNDL